MRATVQRVLSASVSVNGEVISCIKQGICVFVGLAESDTQEDIDYMTRKLLNLRIFESADGKRWDKSVSDYGLEVLCVSQFTLMATLKGHKPDYRFAMAAKEAPNFYQQFITALRKCYQPHLVKDGKFGAYMNVHIENDGPVTINIDSKISKNSDAESTTLATDLVSQ